jgi:hypothetical protein
MKSKERNSVINESGLSVSSDKIVEKLQKICENGLSASKLVVSSENTALNFPNRVTKDTFQKTLTIIKKSQPVHDIKLFNVYHQTIEGYVGK